MGTAPAPATKAAPQPLAVSNVRDRILASALAIVGTDGIAALSNRRIAREAGVSLGSVTYHFPTQNDLLREALLSFVAEETSRIRELVQLHDSAEVTLERAAELVAQVARDFAFTEGQFASFELYLEAGRDPALREAATACFAAYDELAAAILAKLGLPHAEAYAPAVVAMIAGMQLRRLATGHQADDIGAPLLAILQLVATP
jgi:AcrR family transcriptional regulator